MTDESPQLSRRERRAQEAREAARRAEDTASLDMSPISDSIPTHAPDGRVLSRRERRRLERLQSPVETWTAEEEMIATGQIPAMTPERIAEQERIAREKAEQAQADALTASQEMPTVTGGQPASAESDGADEHDDRVDDESEPPQRSSLMAAAAQAPEVEPPVAEPESESEPEAAHEPAATELDVPEPAPEAAEDAVEPEPEPESTPEPEAAAAWAAAAEPEPVQESTPEPDSQPEPDAEQPTPQATPLGMPPGMSPEMFAALFPPGSLQRRLMEQQSQTPLPVEPDATATEPAASEPVEDGIAEIRRLSQEAVASIDAASARSAASAPATPSPAPWEDTQAPAESAPEPGADAPSGSAQQWEWHAEPAPPAQETPEETANEFAPIAQDEGSTPGLWQASASAASAPEPDGAEPAPHSGPIRLDAEDFRERAASQQSAPSFDAILGTGDAAQTAALDDISTGEVATGASTFDSVREPSQPALEALSSASAPVTGQWATLPLNQVDHRAQELPEVAPRADIQHPDLSSVGRATFSPQADYSHIEPVPTGQIEVPPREKPQLNPAGGARHFRWVHVLVLGAVAFLIGVVVWNVWGGPS